MPMHSLQCVNILLTNIYLIEETPMAGVQKTKKANFTNLSIHPPHTHTHLLKLLNNKL